MYDGETKDIVVKDIEEKVFRNDDGSKTTQIKFKDQNGLKYKFYSHLKSDPSKMTSAYEMFEQGHIKNGTELEVAFKPVNKEFVNKEGKTIKYIDRFVSFFNLKDMVQIPSAKPKEEEIDISDLPF